MMTGRQIIAGGYCRTKRDAIADAKTIKASSKISAWAP